MSLRVAGSTVIDCYRNRLQELQECENKKIILLLSFIQGNDTPSKKGKVPSFLFGGGCLGS